MQSFTFIETQNKSEPPFFHDTQVRLVIFKLDFLLTPHAFWMFCRLAANSQISDVSASHWYFSSSSKRLQRIHDFNKIENISLFLQMSLDCLNMWPVCWLWYQPEYLQNGTPEMNDLILFPACSLYVHFVLSLTLKARRNSCLCFYRYDLFFWNIFSWFVCSTTWSRLKYLNNSWMDWHYILCRHSWCTGDESLWLWESSNFSRRATSSSKISLVSTSTRRIGTTFCADIHVSQMINLNDVGDPVIFPLAPPFWLTFAVFNKKNQNSRKLKKNQLFYQDILKPLIHWFEYCEVSFSFLIS